MLLPVRAWVCPQCLFVCLFVAPGLSPSHLPRTSAAVTCLFGLAHRVLFQLATALRSRPYQVNCLIAGYDKDDGAGLYFLDYLSTMQKMNFAAHGYAGYFCYSLLDRHWKVRSRMRSRMRAVRKGRCGTSATAVRGGAGVARRLVLADAHVCALRSMLTIAPACV